MRIAGREVIRHRLRDARDKIRLIRNRSSDVTPRNCPAASSHQLPRVGVNVEFRVREVYVD